MPTWACCLDITDNSASGLSEPSAAQYIRTIGFSYDCIDLYTNTHPAHNHCYTSANFYTPTIANIHAGAGWLSEATGRLHTGRSGWHDDQPAYACDVDTRSGTLWRRTGDQRVCHYAGQLQ